MATGTNDANATDAGGGAPAPAFPSPGRGLLLLLALVPVLGGYIALAGVLGISAVYAGFLFLFYWSGLKQAAMSEFAPSLVGAIGGTALGWLMYAMPAQMGNTGFILPGLLIALSIYALICGWLQFLVNPAFMLLLTVATIPALAAPGAHLGMIAAIMLSGAYFGALMVAVGAVSRARAKPAPEASLTTA